MYESIAGFFSNKNDQEIFKLATLLMIEKPLFLMQIGNVWPKKSYKLFLFLFVIVMHYTSFGSAIKTKLRKYVANLNDRNRDLILLKINPVRGWVKHANMYSTRKSRCRAEINMNWIGSMWYLQFTTPPPPPPKKKK